MHGCTSCAVTHARLHLAAQGAPAGDVDAAHERRAEGRRLRGQNPRAGLIDGLIDDLIDDLIDELVYECPWARSSRRSG